MAREICPDALEYGDCDTTLLIEKGGRQMLGLHLRVPTLLGELLGRGEGFLRFERESLQLHVDHPPGVSGGCGDLPVRSWSTVRWWLVPTAR